MGQIKIYLLIGLTGFKMGQILNRAVTYIYLIASYSYVASYMLVFNIKQLIVVLLTGSINY